MNIIFNDFKNNISELSSDNISHVQTATPDRNAPVVHEQKSLKARYIANFTFFFLITMLKTDMSASLC